MKKSLLFVIGLLFVSTLNAQLRAPSKYRVPHNIERSQHIPTMQKLDLSKISTTKEMKANITIDKPVMTPKTSKSPKKAGQLEPFYKRPAGMFYSPFFASNGVGSYSYGHKGFLMAKPFADYTWHGSISGDVNQNTNVTWDLFVRGETYYVDDIYEIIFNSYSWFDDTPILYAVDGDLEDTNAVWYDYRMKTYETQENIGGGVTVNNVIPVQVITADNAETLAAMLGEEGIEFMCSSKSMVWGGRNADQAVLLSRYYGADPVEGNEFGWWFGKNASHVDGIGQMFEKPEHPYLLNKVYLQANEDMVVNAPVRLTCKVYKLDEIPAYIENGNVVLPEIPGELLVTGEGTVTPTTGEDRKGLITFTLYGQDEFDPTLTYEYAPTIDFPIMVVVDDYNDPDKSDLVDFSAYICVDDQVDEGYGELAYMKEGIYKVEYDEQGDTIFDEDGNPKTYFTGEYCWRGMNNRFSGGTLKMMSGFTLFIGIENPFLTFKKDYYKLEDREYTFPREGGLMQKTIENSDSIVAETTSIDFYSTYPFNSGNWKLTYNDSESLPSWLHFNMQDVGSDDFGKLINAQIIADPLPEGLKFREATIRFIIPGDYIDYKFMQGDDSGFIENGIYYTVATDNEVIVSYKGKNFYQGDIVIPATVTHDGIEYDVVAIGESTFQKCPELSSVTIPVEIKSIANNAFIGTNINSICLTGEGDWNGSSLPQNINSLYIGSGVTSVSGMMVNPATIYSYSTTPPTCNDQSFTNYNGALHIPSTSVAAYFTADYWCNFAQIIGDAVEPQGIEVSADSLNLILGDQANLDVSVIPNNATPKTISWFSSDKSIATVTNGVIKSVSTGECDIYATCVGKQSICHVTVKEIVPTAIILSQDSAMLEVNDQLLLTATVLPENSFYKTVTWSSSDESIAIVNNGLLTARKAGECDIIATCRDISAVCHVVVSNQTITISLDMEEVEVLPNHIITITPSSYPNTIQQFIVTSSDPTVAAARYINGKVQVVGIKKGISIITVGSSEPLAIPATCKVTVYTESGDVNGDGFVNIGDVTTMIDYLLGENVEALDSTTADVNHDEIINIGDVTAIIDMLLSL